MLEPMTVSEQPLRKDAERNRQRILDAARELFAERGLGVTLHDIAHRAGVGVGTVYRRYPDKALLIDMLFEQQLEDIQALLQAALADPDPWHGLISFLDQVLERQARDRGLKELLLGMPSAPERATKLRATLHPLAAELVERARAAGQARADCEPQDFGIVQLMVGAVMDAAQDVAPDLWRRYLTILLQGLRAPPAPLEPLPAPTVPPQQMDELLISAWKHRRS
jgi:AcrR family transcriptional regulator